MIFALCSLQHPNLTFPGLQADHRMLRRPGTQRHVVGGTLWLSDDRAAAARSEALGSSGAAQREDPGDDPLKIQNAGVKRIYIFKTN